MVSLPRRAIPPRLPVHPLPSAVFIACTIHGIACAAEAPLAAPLAAAQVVEIRGSKEAEDRTAPSIAASALPGTVDTITAEDIATLAVGRDISNVFQRIPGVVANNIDQGDTGNGFRMRGFATQGTHGADTAIHIDGVPQNIPSSQGGAGHGPAFLNG